MTDHELLDLAAKAAGIKIRSGLIWNPLVDDGDAFRLATRLRIDINFMTEFCVIARSTETVYRYPHSTGDVPAETRRAIVEVAAAIGRSMP